MSSHGNLVVGATLATLVLSVAGQTGQHYSTGICTGTGSTNVDYTVAELNAAVPRATRLAIDPVALAGNWYVHPRVAAGICNVRSNEVCFRLCNATPGCNFYSISTIQPCYACFVHRTCVRADIWTGPRGYQVYAMPSPAPTMQPTQSACAASNTHSCDASSTTCTTNTANMQTLQNSQGTYACACRPGYTRQGGVGTSTTCVQITTQAPSQPPSFHPCATGQHACKSPSTVCTDIIGPNMTTLGADGDFQYSCACNRAQGYTERINSWQCELASVLNVDDDPAFDLAGNAVEMIATLNATVQQLSSTVAAQQVQINNLVSLLQTAAQTSNPPQTPPGANPSVFQRPSGNLVLSSSSGVEVNTGTCSNADLCDAVNFAYQIKNGVGNL